MSKPERDEKWNGRQIDDGDGKSKRVDCTTNIDIANSSPPVVRLVKDNELTNESFKTSAKRKANSDFKCRHSKLEEQSFNVTDECNVAR